MYNWRRRGKRLRNGGKNWLYDQSEWRDGGGQRKMYMKDTS